MVSDVVDHVGVVVGGQEALPLAAVLHRQEADEVRQPGERDPLLARVLVQVVVELPRLVPDPEVVALIAHYVVEQHEVGRQDLVHPAQGLEAVQVVLGRLRLDVLRLVGQMGAGGVDALALTLEHPGHRVLGEPVDLQVRLEPAELAGDRDVTLRVAEPDRGGDVEGPGTAVRPVDRGVARRALPPEGVLREVAESQVDLDGLAGVGEVAGTADRLELPVAEAGQRSSVARRRDLVTVALDHQHRAVQALRQSAQGGPVAVDLAKCGGRHRRGVGLQSPSDPVLDALCGMTLREAPRDEPLHELRVPLGPVVEVHVTPPAEGHMSAGSAREVLAQQERPVRRGVWEEGADEGSASDALWGEARQLQLVLGAA